MSMRSINAGDAAIGTPLAPAGPSSTLKAGTPEWWLPRLESNLAARSGKIKRFEDYYSGIQNLAFATEQFRKAFGETFKAFSDNWMQIVVDAVEERLDVEGFRIPADTAEGDPEELTTGDTEAWDIWQSNLMDAESQLVHTDSLVDGLSYVIVGPGGDYPEITGESALQVICESVPGYRSKRLAALKKWKDDTDGFAYATLYLPDEVYKFRSKSKLSSDQTKITWERREVGGEAWPMSNPLGVVPVIPFPNRPRLMSEGRSEIADLIPLQDAINKLFMDMLVASEFAGFPQRVATGIEIPTDPETGQPVTDLWKMSIDRFLHTSAPAPGASFSSLAAADLGNYTNAIAMGIQHLASRSSTPPHYFLASMGNFPSGEALKAAETGLVSKVRRRQRFFGEAWEEVIRLSFLAMGDETKARKALGAEVIWRDPESRAESEHVDAIVKLSSLGVPNQMLWEKSGTFSDADLRRMEQMIAAEAAAAEAQAKAQATSSVVNVETPAITAPVSVTTAPPPVRMRRVPVRDAKGVITHIDEVPV